MCASVCGVRACLCVCVCISVCGVCVCACTSIKNFFIYVISFDMIRFERKFRPSTGGALIQVWF